MALYYKEQLLAGDARVDPDIPYSYDEVRIGTWVDGKPLYRKVLVCPVPSKADEAATIYTGDSTELVVKFQSFIYWASTSTYNLQPIPIGATNAAGGTNVVYYFSLYNTKNPNTFVAKTNNSGWLTASVRVLIIMEYTKTTD